MLQKQNKKKSSLFIAALALLLAAVIVYEPLAAGVYQVYADTNTYISDVKVFSADTLEKAISKCRDAGYTAVENNLNHSADGDLKENGIYVLGYKTTHKEEDGITGLSMLQMNAGYQDYTYGDVAEISVEKMGTIPGNLNNAVSEFAKNYEKKSPAAAAAVEILNCYHIDEMQNRKLGDYLVSGSCTEDFIKKLMARSSTSMVSAFCNALVAGVADPTSGDNWAVRISRSSDLQNQLQDADNYKRLDSTYKTVASDLTDSLQSFSKAFHEAETRYKENNNQVEVPETEEKKLTDMPDETVEDMSNGAEIQSEDGDLLYLYAYDVLNQYNYDENTRLGDYIVSLGDTSFDEMQNLRKIYPLAAALTDGQAAVMRMSGVALCAMYLVNDEALVDSVKDQVKVIRNDISKKTETDSMSIWAGTDQTAYNQKVAVTKDAYRANAAGQIYNTLTSPDDVDDFLKEARSKLEIVSAVVSLGVGITTLTATVIGSMSAFAIGSVGVSASIWTVCSAGIGAGVISSIFGVMGCTFIVLSYVALVAMIILFVTLFIKWIWDKYTDDDAEEFTPIPEVLFDYADNRYVRYEAVYEGNSPANINGSNARRWNALYCTRSSHAGEAIHSSEIDDLICVQYDNIETPSGYTPVKNFGETAAANLNANSKSDSSSVFMFTKINDASKNESADQSGSGEAQGDASAESKEKKSGEKDTTEGTVQRSGEYLSKLVLSVSSSETAAKAALTKSGLNVLDVNLSPSTASIKKYTYLGYTTTSNPDDAITDIRISARNQADVYRFGDASYTACGTTPTGDTLYYTSYDSAGSPVLADLLIKNSLEDQPSGYEPVNMFCGGNAFNFNTGTETENSVTFASDAEPYEHWNDKGMYLYFRPSEAYTEGEEYISGLVLVAGRSDTDSADDYIKALGLKKFKQNLTQNLNIQLPSESHGPVTTRVFSYGVDTYICYTTTHNPYRAIYGVRSYAAAPGNLSVPSSLTSKADGSYAVCDIMYELPRFTSLSEKLDRYLRGFYESHSYQFACSSGVMSGIENQKQTTELAPEDYENVSWKSSGVRAKGIYVLGPVSNGTPMTTDDLVVSSDDSAPEGFTGVQDFKTPNRTGSNNLGYNCVNTRYLSGNKEVQKVYMYTRGTAPVKKKYISSINVSSYTLEKAVGGSSSDLDKETKKTVNRSCNDFCMQNLIASCTDEMIQANLAVDSSDSFYSNPDAENSLASYIGVSRTDSETEAITGIIKYRTEEDHPPSVIKVDDVDYQKAGDKIQDGNGSYYLYYTKSAGANPGRPITSLDVSSEVFAQDCATALTASSTDGAEKAVLYGDDESSAFIHMKYNDTATVMGNIFVGHGKTRKAAQCNLLSLGCNMCIDLDLNKDAGGEYVYVGYTRYTMTSRENRKGTPLYAVRDIVLTVGEAHQKTISINNITYKAATDEYSNAEDNDGSKGVSLNAGTGGKQIYLYYTTTQTEETSDPVTRLGISCRDFSLISSGKYQWEHILDRNGSRVNLNEGVIGTTNNGKRMIDNRIYLYAARTGNTVKESAAVSDATLSSDFSTYDVYMKGAS